MLSFQRRLDLLNYIPRYPNKISTRQLLALLEGNGHENLIIRKIQRDLEAIESLGMFGLEVDKRSKPYGWSISLNWKKLNIALMDANSALAFSTLEEIVGTLLPESTLEDLSPYFKKAKIIIDSENSPLISHWKSSVALIHTHNPVSLPLPDEEALAQIKKAIFHKKQITADLKRYLLSKKEPVWKRYQYINPLGLIQRESVITLICSLGSFHQKIYKFPLAFIKNIEIDKATVITPRHYNFEKVKHTLLSPPISHKEILLCLLVRKDSYFVMHNGKFNDNQVTMETDNSELVKITATVTDTPKLRAFLRGLGSSVEVLEPAYLRAYFKELAQELLTKYQ